MVTASVSLDPFRSPIDKKTYRLITLENGLEALLIRNEAATPAASTVSDSDSDLQPDAEPLIDSPRRSSCSFASDDEFDDDEEENDDKSALSNLHAAACMTVGVGSMADPADVRGLAHYLEHMLFMGSEKYPDENEFEAFLSTHGGYSNGATECETTRYLFEVGPLHLQPALDMFAQFFIAPLFKQEAMARELLAVESEFNRAMQNDYVRLQQVQCETCAPHGHSYNCFSWGNAKSLQQLPEAAGIDVRTEMIKFYEMHYSADAMKLCVYGQNSLDDLERWVTESFSKIPNRTGCTKRVCEPIPRPFGIHANQEPTLIKLIPVKKTHAMHLYWMLPSLLRNYRQKPWEYLAHVLGHECDGSLTSILKHRRWATHVSAGISERDGFEFGSFGSLFEVNISLTRSGLENWDKVIQFIFDVVHFIRTQGFHEWIFEELKASYEMNFLFQEEQEPIALCRRMSELMQTRHGVERDDLLRYDTLQGDFDMQQTQALLNEMTPQNTRILLLSHSFEERLDKEEVVHTERWFGAKYSISTIPIDLLQRWSRSSGIEQLSEPSQNRFMPHHFNVLPLETAVSSLNGSEETAVVCELVHKTRMSKLWFKQDDTFRIPKTNANFLLCLPSLTKNVSNFICAKIYIKIVNDALKQVAYQASSANLHFELSIRDLDIEATFSGFSDKLSELVQVVFQSLLMTNITESNFSVLKEELIKEYRNLNLRPSMKARYMRLQLLERITFPVDEKLNTLQKLTLDDLQLFLTTQMWNTGVSLRSLVHGNSTCESAIELLTEVEALILEMTKRLPPLSPIMPHTTALPVTANGILLRDMSDHEQEPNSTVEVYFQLGKCDHEERAYAELLHQIMQEPLFHELRTRQQLGYEVYCCVRDTHGVIGFSILVQSASHSSGEIAVCIDSFIHEHFRRYLMEELDKEHFAKHVTTLQRLKTRPDTNLMEETERYWEEIQGRRYDFHMERQLVQHLADCTLDDLRKWYTKWMLAEDEQQGTRKLRVHVVGQSSQFVPLEQLVAEEDTPEIIDDLVEFKRALNCHC